MKSVFISLLIINQSLARLNGCSSNGIYSLGESQLNSPTLNLAKEALAEDVKKWVLAGRISSDSDSIRYVANVQGKPMLVEQIRLKDGDISAKANIENQIRISERLCQISSSHFPVDQKCATEIIPQYEGCLETEEHAFLFYEKMDFDLKKQRAIEAFLGKSNQDFLNNSLNLAKKVRDLADFDFIHCEINPSSILSTDSSDSDFKIFRFSSIVNPMSECQVTQTAFLPSEQVDGKFTASQPASVYSLAMTILLIRSSENEYINQVSKVCITEDLNPDECSARHKNFISQILASSNLSSLDNFFEKATSFKPEERHKNLTEFVEGLENEISKLQKSQSGNKIAL